jgi:acetyl esterase/lipase
MKFCSARFLLAAALSVLPACGVIERAGVGLMADRAKLPAAQIQRNIPYEPDAGFERSLDLYLPKEQNAPVLIFVHGGGWNTGDKDLRAGNLDVYGNIGRFYATQGIVTAVINYRLQPKAKWREQAEDVAYSVAWVREHIAQHGGDPGRIFIMGHSAGAQLAAHVALNQGLQTAAGIPGGTIKGLISASGAGLDLLDEQTYKTEDPNYYEKRFGPRSNRVEWASASPITSADENDPPTLVMYASGESKGLQRQAQKFAETLQGIGVKTRLLKISGESHSRMVLVLSHPKKAAVPAILQFIRSGSPLAATRS